MLQLTLDAVSTEDRLLLKVGLDDEQVLLWLTRHMVKSLWPLLGHASLQLVPNQGIPAAMRHEVAEMQRQVALRDLDYATPYRTERKTVWNGGPQVVTQADLLQEGNGMPMLRLTAANGGYLNFTLDARLQAGLVELLRKAVSQTDWDLILEMKPTPTAQAAVH